MTNEELKKKIKEILRKRMTELLGSCHTDEIPLTEEGAEAILFYAYEFADALIAAGIGDVKEAEHRTDIAEHALHFLARSFAEALCKKGTPQYIADGFIKDAYKQAEKELVEEENDGKKEV